MGNIGSLILQRKDVFFTFIHMTIGRSATYKKLASFSLITRQNKNLSRIISQTALQLLHDELSTDFMEGEWEKR
jgi:hypothetical protein